MNSPFDERQVVNPRMVVDPSLESSSIRGAARETRAWLAASLHDLARNLVLGWPIPVSLVVLVLASAAILTLEGSAVDFWDGVYKALLALHGDAIADAQHASPLVRWLTVVDWFGGLILLGTFVWLITVSFEHGRAQSRRQRARRDAPRSGPGGESLVG